MYLISSLTYFLVFDLPPTNQGYIIFNGYPAVLVSVAGCHSTLGVEQDINVIPTSFKTIKYKIGLVGRAGFEPAKA